MNLAPSTAKIKFEDYEPLLRKLAGKYAGYAARQKLSTDFDDFYSEACYGFVQCLNNYDPNRGTKFITLLHVAVSNDLKNRLMTLGRRKYADVINYEDIVNKLTTKLGYTEFSRSDILAGYMYTRGEYTEQDEYLGPDIRALVDIAEMVLRDREYAMWYRRYIKGETYISISRSYNVSYKRIEQIVNKAQKKLIFELDLKEHPLD